MYYIIIPSSQLGLLLAHHVCQSRSLTGILTSVRNSVAGMAAKVEDKVQSALGEVHHLHKPGEKNQSSAPQLSKEDADRAAALAISFVPFEEKDGVASASLEEKDGQGAMKEGLGGGSSASLEA